MQVLSAVTQKLISREHFWIKTIRGLVSETLQRIQCSRLRKAVGLSG